MRLELLFVRDLPNVDTGEEDEVENLPHKSWLMEGFPLDFLRFPPQDGDGVVIKVVRQNA